MEEVLRGPEDLTTCGGGLRSGLSHCSVGLEEKGRKEERKVY